MNSNQDHSGLLLLIIAFAAFLVVTMIVQCQNTDAQDVYNRHQAGKRKPVSDFYSHDAFMKNFAVRDLWQLYHQLMEYEAFMEDPDALTLLNLQNAYCEMSEDYKELVGDGDWNNSLAPSREELEHMKQTLAHAELEFVSTYGEIPEGYKPYFEGTILYAARTAEVWRYGEQFK